MTAATSVSHDNCTAGGGIWTNQPLNIFAKLRYHSVDANGKTQISEDNSSDTSFSLDGNGRDIMLGGFTDRAPIGASELSIYAKINLAGTSTPVLLSGICKSDNATPLTDCGSVDGNFDIDTNLCFNSSTANCTSTNNAIMIYPIKSAVKFKMSSHYTMSPVINW